MATLALFLRAAHIKPRELSGLMVLLLMSIPALALGIFFAFLAKNAKNKYDELDFFLRSTHGEISPYREKLLRDLRNNHERISIYADRSIELCGLGLALSLVIVIALPICVAFFAHS